MNHIVMLDREDIEYGKALQVYLKNIPYLVIGWDGRNHHEMLKRFLSDNEVPFIVLKGKI